MSISFLQEANKFFHNQEGHNSSEDPQPYWHHVTMGGTYRYDKEHRQGHAVCQTGGRHTPPHPPKSRRDFLKHGKYWYVTIGDWHSAQSKMVASQSVRLYVWSLRSEIRVMFELAWTCLEKQTLDVKVDTVYNNFFFLI
jgi:hypothetical protein